MSIDLSSKRSSIIVSMIFVLIVVLGLIYIRYVWFSVKNETSNNLMKIAKTAEVTLPKEYLKGLSITSADTGKYEYKIIKGILKEIIKVNNSAKFAYIYMLQNGDLYFMADSEPENSQDYSPPGQEFTEAKKIDKQPFVDGKAIVTEETSDRWGTWISVLIPIKDKITGKVIAVFGMDYNASSQKNLLLTELLKSLIMVVMILMLLYIALKMVTKNKILNNEILSRKIAEKSLQESLTMFTNMFRNHSSIMLLIDPVSGKIIDANSSAFDFYGYSLEELKSMTIDRINILDIEEISKQREYAFNGERNCFIFPHRRANGEVRTVEVYSSKIEMNQQHLLFSIIHDITERREAENLLKQTRVNYETFFNSINDFLFVLDEQANIIHINNTVFNRLGYTKDELIGTSVLMIHPRKEEKRRDGL